MWVHADTKSKVGSAFNLYIKLEEEGRDMKPVEGSQTQLPPIPIGNSQKAIVYGAQQLDLMQRHGWQTIFDSYNKGRDPQPRGSSQVSLCVRECVDARVCLCVCVYHNKIFALSHRAEATGVPRGVRALARQQKLAQKLVCRVRREWLLAGAWGQEGQEAWRIMAGAL